MGRGMRAGAMVASLALVAGCGSAPSSVPAGARAADLARAAEALGPVAPAWTAIETAPICDDRAGCSDPGRSFTSRRTGGSPETVCAEAAPWVERSFGVQASVEDCIDAMAAPADPSTTQPGYRWDIGASVAQVADRTATWQVLVYAASVDFGAAGSGAAGVPVSYQAGGYLYDGDRVELLESLTGAAPSQS